jgi:L-ascorbate metabolism protein UlaG (beta-lactamase superfamily)
MDITFLGHSSFKIRGRSTTLVTDPFDPKMVGLKYPRVSAEIVTVSHDHDDHNQAENVSGVKKVISGPGEYEIMGVSIIGIPSFHDDKNGALRGKNTIYVIEMDGLRVVHLGDLGHKLSEKTIEEIGNVDVLMIPVGGEYTLGASEATAVVRDVEPRIVTPMHYQTKGLNPEVFKKLSGVDSFLSDVGLATEKMDKLAVKKDSLVEDQKVVVLERKG